MSAINTDRNTDRSIDETLDNLKDIKKINEEINSLHSKIHVLRRELDKKKKMVMPIDKVKSLLADLKVPFLLRDIYVFTYYYKGCYAWQHAIFYGLPKKSEYWQARNKLAKEDDGGTMKVASHNFNKVQGFLVYPRNLPTDYIWSEKLRDDDAPPLSPIDKSIIYILTDDKEKGEFDTVLGVYTNPVELVNMLEMVYSSSWSSVEKTSSDFIRNCHIRVSLYVVHGTECCVLYPCEKSDNISFNPSQYNGNIGQILLTLTKKALNI